MGHVGEQITAILTAIVGVAIVAVILSRNSNTAQVISSAAGGFSEALGVAVSPITGSGGTFGPMTGFAGGGFNSGYGSGFSNF